MKQFEVFLLLASACYLQRIEFAGTSVGLIVIASLVISAAFRSIATGRIKLRTSLCMLSYPIFLFTFLYALPFRINESNTLPALVFIAPIFVWLYLQIDDTTTIAHLSFRPSIWIITCALGIVLLKDFAGMFGENEIELKKNFEFANPNFTGFILNILAAIYLTNTSKNKKTDAAYYIISTAIIILTLSKTAYAIQAAILFLYIGPKKIIVTAFFTLTLAAIFGTTLLPDFELFDRILIFFQGDTGGAVDHRIGLLRSAWRIFEDFPLMGIGYENFLKYAYNLYGSPMAVKTHNILFTVLAETGLIGLGILITSQIALLIAIKKPWKLEYILCYGIYWTYSLTHAIGETLAIWPIIIFILDQQPTNKQEARPPAHELIPIKSEPRQTIATREAPCSNP